MKYIFFCSLFFAAHAYSVEKVCTLGGTNAASTSGAMNVLLNDEASCRQKCETEMVAGIKRNPIWAKKGYLYRCAFDGRFIAFQNTAPRPTDPKILQQDQIELADHEKRTALAVASAKAYLANQPPQQKPAEKPTDNRIWSLTATPNKDAAGNMDGMKVVAVVPGGYAESIGIKANDLILKLNGAKIDSMAAASRIFDPPSNNQPNKLEIKRNETILQLPIK